MCSRTSGSQANTAIYLTALRRATRCSGSIWLMVGI